MFAFHSLNLIPRNPLVLIIRLPQLPLLVLKGSDALGELRFVSCCFVAEIKDFLGAFITECVVAGVEVELDGLDLVVRGGLLLVVLRLQLCQLRFGVNRRAFLLDNVSEFVYF